MIAGREAGDRCIGAFMEEFYASVDKISNCIWGGADIDGYWIPAPMVVLLLGSGLYFMLRLKFLPIRRLLPAFGNLFFRSRKGSADSASGGDITPWNAL